MEDKKLYTISATSMRVLINVANKQGIRKEQIVAIQKLDREEYVLIYEE